MVRGLPEGLGLVEQQREAVPLLLLELEQERAALVLRKAVDFGQVPQKQLVLEEKALHPPLAGVVQLEQDLVF